jgi:hypothetical protein
MQRHPNSVIRWFRYLIVSMQTIGGGAMAKFVAWHNPDAAKLSTSG